MFVLSLSVTCFSNTKIIISTGEFPPLNSKFLKHYGLMPKIVTEAFKTEGITVEYVFYPWKRAYLLSKAGKVNGTLQWLYSAKRAKDHYYSDPILEEKTVWFHLKDFHFIFKSLSDLKKIKIGAVRGFTYTPAFYQAIDDKQINVTFVSKAKQNFDKLLKNRIDVFPESIDVGHDEINKYPKNVAMRFTFNKKPFITAWNHLLLSKHHKDSLFFLEKFNRGLKKLKDNGDYERYLLESRQGDYK